MRGGRVPGHGPGTGRSGTHGALRARTHPAGPAPRAKEPPRVRRTAARPRPHLPAGRPHDPPDAPTSPPAGPTTSPGPPRRRSRLSQRALLPALTGAAALAGYRSLELAAGERRRVTVAVTARTLSSWDTARHDWTLGTGRRTLRVGASSGDPGLTADVEAGPSRPDRLPGRARRGARRPTREEPRCTCRNGWRRSPRWRSTPWWEW
ncbi:fibronectin type III-like domain-contianing protein [Streptomyces wedmorensis]|uniref:Fibronectin type III-like domain-contianing protein n=1 Tax=Streptomyces wedmorensis TaxID=43759 RepID=A0ABW6IUA9_STRWE